VYVVIYVLIIILVQVELHGAWFLEVAKNQVVFVTTIHPTGQMLRNQMDATVFN